MPEFEHRHSHISAMLRYEYLENEILFKYELARMVAMSSALGNSALKSDKVAGGLRRMEDAALKRLPYMRPSAEDADETRNRDLVEEYKRMREALTKGREDDGKP